MSVSYKNYVVAALPDGTFKFFATKQTKRFTTFTSFPIAEYLAGQGGSNSTLLIDIFDSPDFDSLPANTLIYSGYGTDGQEMINAGRYGLVYIKNF